ncbi:unnamed protein product [Clonostachys byssicola]|uniref:Uncharacterized protein n=1 Tax=Clonostachys byssicola TaxID=160290 RepID=A0A9N9YBC1_9HYPO|nr:unnamed protein product [Clonostachys byssicola]
MARVALFLCIGVALVEARDSRNQFTEFFTTFNGWYYGEGNSEKCEPAHQNYTSAAEIPGQHRWAWELVDCILGITSEAQKAEFALSATLLTVLPVGLAQIRPGLTETGCLAMRRPFLALMLEFGVPSPNPITGTINGRKVRKLGTSRPLKQLETFRSFRFMFSLLEYILGMGATVNCIYQIYRLCYKAIALAPIAVFMPGLSETAVVLAWMGLLLPIHYLGVLAFAYTYPVAGPRRSLKQWVMDELTPCYYGRLIKQAAWEGLPGIFYHLVACLHIMVGTVLLGSVFFITLAGVLPVIESFVGAALASCNKSSRIDQV